ncbi:tetratricopeptide repeat protein [Zhongshania guokunii]|uniref:Tetratricopeptide repeat protein n=1 Tax=Zhongshania guokunii TaxID=641783 RepID=A0ABV3U8L9_9GAMM
MQLRLKPTPAFTLSVLLSTALLAINAGCATNTSPPLALNIPAPTTAQVNALLQDDASGNESNQNPKAFPEENILAIDPDMRYFVEEHVPAALSPRARLSYLLDSMVRPSQLGLSYDPGITLNATETFYAHRGNCLSLSSLFIALAREANLNAYYNEVTIPPSWDMISDNSMVFYKHINVVVDFGDDGQEVVDLSVDNYEYNYPQQRLSEQEAAAQYYNNRGAEFLNQDQNDEAMRYFRRALYLNPNAGHIWGNLGTLLRRYKRNDDAEIAFRQALTLNPNDQVAISNLSRLYHDLGKIKQAKQLEKASEVFRKQNPFWHYSKAKSDFEQGDFNSALKSINQAIDLDRSEYRFYQFSALVLHRLGDVERAKKQAIKAARLKLKSN